MRRIPRAIVPAFVLFASAAFAQDSLLGADALATDSGRFRLKVEMKMNARTSTSIEFPVANTGAPFPVVLETVSPHTSAEISNISLTAEGDLTPDILAKVVIHFLDLYNRNPTSSADRIFVRGLDLTAEYARNEVTTRKGVLHTDEGLLTLRAAF